jgi:hypothetical protein
MFIEKILMGGGTLDSPVFGVTKVVFMGYLYVWYNMCRGLIEN